MSTLEQIIDEIKTFDSSLYHFYDGAMLDSISGLEKKLRYKLPKDFKEFLLLTNGADTYGGEIYGIREGKKYEDLYGNYIAEKDEVDNPIREYYLPITPDGMGNHECLDLKSISPDGKTCNVIFWQHDWFYEPEDQPDIDAHSFTEYLENVLKNISNNYNCDGSGK
jgi:cell wall assembly regulator SMI1